MDYQSLRSKKKGRRASPRKKAGGPAATNKDEVEINGYHSDDCESVSSMASSIESHAIDDNNEEDEFDYQEDFEAKLIENIEGARQKNSRNRQICLMEVKKALCRRYINEFVVGREETILDFIEKLLKKGQKEDRILSSAISCALCIQLGGGDSARAFTTLKPILINLIGDDTVSPAARASAASALGLCCFIGTEEQEVAVSVGTMQQTLCMAIMQGTMSVPFMQVLRWYFLLLHTVECLVALKAAFSKKIPADTAHHCAFASALLAWGLLLTIAPQSVVEEQVTSCITQLVKLLERADLNLRIAAGETAALVYELGRASRIHFQGPVNVLHTYLRDYANESGRHKGKKEKRLQKASFRDILKTVEHGHSPDETIKFGLEYIQMTSWTWLRRYNAFKDTLGSGTNLHLESNMLLREVFELGLPVAKGVKESKVSKYERQLMNSATSKTRTQKRNQRRDNKKSAGGI